ncbi:MAG: D-glycerate dehydrogenase [Dehalococcoidia bacterium]
MADRPRVFVTRRLPGVAPLARLEEVATADVWEHARPPAAAEVTARAEGCTALLPMLTERIDGALLDACPTVHTVANMAVGYDNIDVPAATERGVLVTNTPDVLTDTTADIAFALLLAAARRVTEGERKVRAGEWGTWQPDWLLGRDVHGATLGIVGPGRIGRAVARRAAGFDMRVLYSGRREVADFPGEYVSFEALLERSDFVSVHVPLTPETAGLFGADVFRRMKPTAIFVNTARGGVVDQQALRDALVRGEIAAAGLDVTTPEPLPPDDPLLEAPNLVITPHLGSATAQTREAMADLAVDALRSVFAGERPRHLVNPDAWSHWRGRR